MRPAFDFGLGIKWFQFVGYLLSKVDYNTWSNQLDNQ